MKKNFIEIVSLLYVSLLLYTGLAKLIDHELTREQMAMMPLVGKLSLIITWLLPICEFLIGLMIFIPKFRVTGLKAGVSLMAFFTLYVAYLMKFNPTLPCTCGGLLQEMSWPQHLIFNAVFTLFGGLALYGLVKKPVMNLKPSVQL